MGTGVLALVQKGVEKMKRDLLEVVTDVVIALGIIGAAGMLLFIHMNGGF